MRLLLLLMSLAIVGGCDVLSKSIPGSGVIKREARQVGEFTKVSFAGGADLQIEAGAGQGSCEIQCDDNLMEYIKTDVIDGELQIRLAKGARISPTNGLLFEIKVTNLGQLDLAGVTTTSISGMKQAEFQVKLAGSHEVNCAGEVDTAQFESAGTCKILASQLKTKSTSIEVAGSGTAEVQASDTLTVEIAGSGTVRYLGDPSVKQSIAGAGKIEKMADKVAEPQ